MRVLALNAGSSSHRAQMFATTEPLPLEPPEPAWQAEVESRSVTFDELLAKAPPELPDIVAHRVVHPGLDPSVRFDERIDDRMRAIIRAAREFAPQHNDLALEGIEAALRRFPQAVQIAVFDRALDRDAPDVARTLSVPSDWSQSYGLARLGFHGISHHDVIARAHRLLGRSDVRVLTIHLGSGCSIAAFDGTRMIDTTMGMTPMEGLMMGARSGSIDPGAIFFLLRRGHAADTLEKALNAASGLLGVSGASSDSRDVIAAMDAGDARARLAFDLYTYRIRLGVAGMAAAIGGFSAITWSGPVGEHMPRIRAAVSEKLRFLGVAIDRDANENMRPDADVSAGDATARSFVIRTLEEWAMVRRAAAVMDARVE